SPLGFAAAKLTNLEPKVPWAVWALVLGAYPGRADRAGQRDASLPRREDEGVRMHVESEQRRRAPRLCRLATGALPGQAQSWRGEEPLQSRRAPEQIGRAHV